MIKESNTFVAWIKRKKWWLITILVIIVGWSLISSGNKDQTSSKFATVSVSRGELRQVVTATGEIKPVNTVNVGSQVSGTIQKIYVDYNSKVKKGDILLTIDPSVLKANVAEAKASLLSSESQRNYAKNEYTRNKSLYSDGFIARAELEQSQTTYEQAEQSVKRAKSEYERAATNLDYATIKSPVDGTVIARKVDKGQTVAASFQTPDLFEIAEDLSKMQIETSVSEADIGMIKEGLPVTFTVDAYPTQTFSGNVRQIRLSPTTTSNVVVYTVVIDVDNSDMRLMPGMTAFVTIIIEDKKDVLRVSNSAFLLRNFEGIVSKPGSATPKTHLPIERNNSVVLVAYTKGLTTSTETELVSKDLKDGDKVITGVLGKTASKTSNMGGGGGPGGGPM
ncbi:MAG TPA: efflux RND transporter periplasmic adaptor subunit [Alphaproteobacteria bacterium]|nr:efflux RND transporter periplasmic adaptor subunit [Alphaproteobacteria bacterium]